MGVISRLGSRASLSAPLGPVVRGPVVRGSEDEAFKALLAERACGVCICVCLRLCVAFLVSYRDTRESLAALVLAGCSGELPLAMGASPRGRLRRSTHIGGIATDHGATARAARSTPSPSWSLKWREAPTGRRHRRSAKRRQAISEPPAAALQSASPEDISTAVASPAEGHYAGALASPEDSARPEASHK